MALNITGHWHKPISLLDGSKSSLILTCSPHDIKKVPTASGVYIFGRKYGSKVTPLYVGQSLDLRARLNYHLKSSVKLLTRIREEADNGGKIFMYCEVQPKSGQRIQSVLNVLENALIEYFLVQGHELYQKQGVKRKEHQITFTGNRSSEAVLPRTMRARAT